MILGTLENSKRIELLHPAFKTLFEYVKSHNFLKEKETCVKLDGDNLYINNSESELRDKREIQLIEVHRKYIDVHIPLDKMETIGWKPLSKLSGEKEGVSVMVSEFVLSQQSRGSAAKFGLSKWGRISGVFVNSV